MKTIAQKIKTASLKIALWCCFLLITNSAIAQKDFPNSISFTFSNFSIPGLPAPTFMEAINIFPPAQLGIYYKRKIYKNWNIMLGYSQYNDFLYSNQRFLSVGPIIDMPQIVLQNGSAIIWRYGYRMTDFFIDYHLDITQRHKINLELGASYYWGKNTVVDSVSKYSPEMYLSDHNAAYWGIVPAISYDYICLWKRLNIGLDLRFRKYFNLPATSEQIDYGVHLGINF